MTAALVAGRTVAPSPDRVTAWLAEPPTRRRPQPWSKYAACDGMVSADWDPFTPDDELPEEERDELFELARATCRTCQVEAVCLFDALDVGDFWSMRGGTTPKERNAIAKQRGFPRPSISGSSQHGTRGRYVEGCTCGPDGKACPGCRWANARYIKDWRAQRGHAPRVRGHAVQALGQGSATVPPLVTATGTVDTCGGAARPTDCDFGETA